MNLNADILNLCIIKDVYSSQCMSEFNFFMYVGELDEDQPFLSDIIFLCINYIYGKISYLWATAYSDITSSFFEKHYI